MVRVSSAWLKEIAILRSGRRKLEEYCTRFSFHRVFKSRRQICSLVKPVCYWSVPREGKRDLEILTLPTEKSVGKWQIDGDVVAAAFSPDGKQLHAVAKKDGGHTLVVWNVGAGVARRFDCGRNSGRGLAVSPDARFVAFVGQDEVELKNTQTGRIHRKLPIGNVSVVRFSPNGQWLAASENGGNTTLWDVEEGRLAHTLRGYAFPNCFSGDSQYLWTVRFPGLDTTWHWDLQTGQPLKEFALTDLAVGHANEVNGFDIVDGTLLATAGGTVRFWNMTNGRQVQVLKAGERQNLRAIGFSPDRRYMIIGGHDRRVRIWDWKSGEEVLRLPSDWWAVDDVGFDAAGKLIYAVDKYGVKIWNNPLE